MGTYRLLIRSHLQLLLLLALPSVLSGQPVLAQPSAETQALVQRALANELRAAQDAGHPIRYRLRKTSPRLTTTKLIVESRDGAVARLISVNGEPLSESDEKKELARLQGLLDDPERQRHRKQNEDADAARALKVLRALPKAFLYSPENGNPPAQGADPGAGGGAGSDSKQGTGSAGSSLVRFTFKPNPAFNPPDLETQVLTEMAGEIWIDPAAERVTHLDGRLLQDVDFGWGILGRLNRGGSIAIDQADVGDHQWRIVRFKMTMSGRVFIRTKIFDTEEEESRFAPVPVGMDYRQAIEMLLENAETAPPPPSGK
jgi:hypothetical protein